MAAKWPAEKRDRCMGAMWASATEHGGEWFPHYALVSEQEGVNYQTLRRWWAERDRAQDVKSRAVSTRARDARLVDGADAWTTGMIDKLRRLMDINLTEERVDAADLDAAARAFKATSETVATLRALAEPADDGDSGGDPGVVEIRVRGALARVRT